MYEIMHEKKVWIYIFEKEGMNFVEEVKSDRIDYILIE